MIKQMRVRNFKCFKNQLVQLGKLTLLSGLNGMGKSSLLQTLLLLRQSHQRGLLKTSGLSLNGELVNIGTAHDALFDNAEEEYISIELLTDSDISAQWRFNYNQEADVLKTERRPDSDNIYQTSLFNDNFHYLHAERIGPRHFFKMSDYQVRQHSQIGSKGEYTAHYLSFFLNKGIKVLPDLAHPKATFDSANGQSFPYEVKPLDSSEESNPKGKVAPPEESNPKEKDLSLTTQLQAWMAEISPGTRLHLEAHNSMDLINMQYSFEGKRDVSRPFRSGNVGFGITYTLPILAVLLTSPPGALVLIENPEAHLHPHGQMKIGELAARAAAAGVQVIMESHSDHVLNGIRLAAYQELIDPDAVRLHFFERGDRGEARIESPRIDSNGRIDQWPEGFFDVWDKCLDALLEPKDA